MAATNIEKGRFFTYINPASPQLVKYKTMPSQKFWQANTIIKPELLPTNFYTLNVNKEILNINKLPDTSEVRFYIPFKLIFTGQNTEFLVLLRNKQIDFIIVIILKNDTFFNYLIVELSNGEARFEMPQSEPGIYCFKVIIDNIDYYSDSFEIIDTYSDINKPEIKTEKEKFILKSGADNLSLFCFECNNFVHSKELIPIQRKEEAVYVPFKNMIDSTIPEEEYNKFLNTITKKHVGMQHLINTLRRSDKKSEINIIEKMFQSDSNLAMDVTKNIFTFNVIPLLKNTDLEDILKIVNINTIATALRGETKPFIDKITLCMQEERKEKLFTLLDNEQIISDKEVDAAQKSIVEMIRAYFQIKSGISITINKKDDHRIFYDNIEPLNAGQKVLNHNGHPGPFLLIQKNELNQYNQILKDRTGHEDINLPFFVTSICQNPDTHNNKFVEIVEVSGKFIFFRALKKLEKVSVILHSELNFEIFNFDDIEKYEGFKADNPGKRFIQLQIGGISSGKLCETLFNIDIMNNNDKIELIAPHRQVTGYKMPYKISNPDNEVIIIQSNIISRDFTENVTEEESGNTELNNWIEYSKINFNSGDDYSGNLVFSDIEVCRSLTALDIEKGRCGCSIVYPPDDFINFISYPEKITQGDEIEAEIFFRNSDKIDEIKINNKKYSIPQNDILFYPINNPGKFEIDIKTGNKIKKYKFLITNKKNTGKSFNINNANSIDIALLKKFTRENTEPLMLNYDSAYISSLINILLFIYKREQDNALKAEIEGLWPILELKLNSLSKNNRDNMLFMLRNLFKAKELDACEKYKDLIGKLLSTDHRNTKLAFYSSSFIEYEKPRAIQITKKIKIKDSNDIMSLSINKEISRGLINKHVKEFIKKINSNRIQDRFKKIKLLNLINKKTAFPDSRFNSINLIPVFSELIDLYKSGIINGFDIKEEIQTLETDETSVSILAPRNRIRKGEETDFEILKIDEKEKYLVEIMLPPNLLFTDGTSNKKLVLDQETTIFKIKGYLRGKGFLNIILYSIEKESLFKCSTVIFHVE